jgi:hypothetical protein
MESLLEMGSIDLAGRGLPSALVRDIARRAATVGLKVQLSITSASKNTHSVWLFSTSPFSGRSIKSTNYQRYQKKYV